MQLSGQVESVALGGTNPSLGGLEFLWLELTGKCNLTCVHCYAESSPALPLSEGMRLGDWKRVLGESHELGCRKVQFIGGEPTLYPGLVDLIHHAHHLGYEFIEVFTNGTRLKAEMKDAFSKYHVNLAFSVYADVPSIHDSVTRTAGSFGKTLQTIKWALSEGLHVRVAIVKMNENLQVIERTRLLFEDLGVDDVRVDGIRGVGRGSAAKTVASPMDELCGSCWEGKLCVTSNGTMFPCVFSRSWQVGTFSEGVKAAIEGEPLFVFRSKLKSKADQPFSTPAQCPPPPTPCGPNKPCGPDTSPGPGCILRCLP